MKAVWTLLNMRDNHK